MVGLDQIVIKKRPPIFNETGDDENIEADSEEGVKRQVNCIEQSQYDSNLKVMKENRGSHKKTLSASDINSRSSSRNNVKSHPKPFGAVAREEVRPPSKMKVPKKQIRSRQPENCICVKKENPNESTIS